MKTAFVLALTLVLVLMALHTLRARANVRVCHATFQDCNSTVGACPFQAKISSVKLITQYSSEPCVEGSTYGVQNKTVLVVSGGCSGKFKIRFCSRL